MLVNEYVCLIRKIRNKSESSEVLMLIKEVNPP